MNASVTAVAASLPLSRSEPDKLSIHTWVDKHLSPFGAPRMRRSRGRMSIGAGCG